MTLTYTATRIFRTSGRKSGALAAMAMLGLLASGCSTSTTPPVAINSLPALSVAATGETQAVGTVNRDAADDPAIWVNRDNPQASLIVGTDKRAGLYVYDLEGNVKNFLPAGRLNNVALFEGEHGVLIAASDRSDPANGQIALFAMDTENGALAEVGKVSSGAGEAYGLCMAPAARALMIGAPDGYILYAVHKDGTVRQIRLNYKPGEVNSEITDEWKLQSQAEGCVVDPETSALYVAEEDRGIWRIDAGQMNAAPVLVAPVDGQHLVADVEGLAIARSQHGPGWLIASSQGDNAYAVYSLSDGSFAGRFRIEGGAIDGTSETDGIEVVTSALGPQYPQGLFVAQDGDNGNGTQNFKLVSWADIAARLGLE